MEHASVPDNTPILVGAGQFTGFLDTDKPLLSAPMDLAARASVNALADAGGELTAADLETVAAIRLFSDSVPTWACPFGGADNPPAAPSHFRSWRNSVPASPAVKSAVPCSQVQRRLPVSDWPSVSVATRWLPAVADQRT